MTDTSPPFFRAAQGNTVTVSGLNPNLTAMEITPPVEPERVKLIVQTPTPMMHEYLNEDQVALMRALRAVDDFLALRGIITEYTVFGDGHVRVPDEVLQDLTGEDRAEFILRFGGAN